MTDLAPNTRKELKAAGRCQAATCYIEQIETRGSEFMLLSAEIQMEAAAEMMVLALGPRRALEMIYRIADGIEPEVGSDE